jgi:hypothetical protein
VPWKLTIRVGPRVERARFAHLDAALKDLEARASALARRQAGAPVDVKLKRFEPEQQVTARLELAGPERWLPKVRAGVDVHGDGSTEAYLGQVRRRSVNQRRRESAFDALRRELDQPR